MSVDKAEFDVDNKSIDQFSDQRQNVHQESPSLISKLIGYTRSPWGQVWVISFVCFCLPGMYNALGGMGGSGQVDPTVAANATVALLSVGAATSVFFVAPFVSWIGPRVSLIIGGWTYALYSGSLLNYNHRQNAAFTIASGAILGLGANFLWIPQGMIMTTYVKDEARGRAIALFWIIFNLGGGVGSLASFGINYNSASGTVTDSTYIAYMVTMLFGWIVAGLFVCTPKQLNDKFKGERISKVEAKHKESISLSKIKDSMILTYNTALNWRVICLIPMFFNANVFYSYQQNSVNGMTFNVRTRSLNGALYWMAQMLGGLVIGAVLDLKYIKKSSRPLVGWFILFVTGMVIWGGGLSFQFWNDKRMAQGLVQIIDYTERKAIGPIFLYIFYGTYDALWQGFCYWMIGTLARNPTEGGILVGTYKTMQCIGGAMAWRVNALHVAPKTQLAMNWGLTGGGLIIALPCVISFLKKGQEPIEDLEQGSLKSTSSKEVKPIE